MSVSQWGTFLKANSVSGTSYLGEHQPVLSLKNSSANQTGAVIKEQGVFECQLLWFWLSDF